MQSRSQTQIRYEYAGLGLRIAATIIDTGALFFCMIVIIAIGAVTGLLELPGPDVNPFDAEAVRAAMPSWLSYATYALIFVYYSLFESLLGATPGKFAVGTRVRMDDGRSPTPAAIVMRNFIRIPELILWYIPSVISCQVSGSRKRLGDYAAHTVVVRHSPSSPKHAKSRMARATAGQVPAAPAPAVAGPEPSSTPDLPTALAQLEAAVRSAAAAHQTFRRVSADELVREQALASDADDNEAAYSAPYVAGWYALADAVHELNVAWNATTAAAGRTGLSLGRALDERPDLGARLRRLAPYLEPGAEEDLSGAYVRVVRAGAAV